MNFPEICSEHDIERAEILAYDFGSFFLKNIASMRPDD